MRRRIRIRFDPTREGLGQILGGLEAEIMDVLWKRGEASAREVLEAIPRDLSYSAVITVANRLVEKGILKRRREGKTYFFQPRLDRRQLIEAATQQIWRTIASLAPPETVVGLMEQAIEDDPATLESLGRLIDAKRRERKGDR